MIATACVCMGLVSCTTPNKADTVRELLDAALSSGPERVHSIAVTPDRLVVTTVADAHSTSAHWTLSSGSDQSPDRSDPSPVDQPSVDPEAVDVDDLVTRVRALTENCSADTWEVDVTVVTTAATLVTETCGQQTTDHLAGTQMPPITQPFSIEGLAIAWQELSEISPDGRTTDVLINTDAVSAGFAAGPEQPTCEVRYQRDLAVPQARSVCRTATSDRQLLDLSRHDAEEVWGRTQALAQTNGIALTEITTLHLAPTGASDGSATLQLSTTTRTFSTVLKGDS